MAGGKERTEEENRGGRRGKRRRNMTKREEREDASPYSTPKDTSGVRASCVTIMN